MYLRRSLATAYTTVLVCAAAVTGCHKQPPVVVAPVKPINGAPAAMNTIDLKSLRPNEAGAIMLVMYHRIRASEPNRDLNRQPDTFRKDLETFYTENYRPITVQQLVTNRIDVPAGKTPIVLTFDDALPTQFRVLPDKTGAPHIDPDCAVGILETFHKAHPDWPLSATFYVLPKEGKGAVPFGQEEYVTDKFTYLLKHGYEIGNHTSTHPHMRRMSPDRIQWELATAKRDIQAIAPAVRETTFALPYGELPAKASVQYLVKGSNGGTEYQFSAIVLAAWRPVLSPITKASRKATRAGTFAVFNPYRLERVLPDPRQATKAGTLEYWLKYFEANPSEKYVSDGIAGLAVVPTTLKSRVDPERVKKYGQTLQLYADTGTTGAGGLSVK